MEERPLVNVTLIDALLELTPEERLRQNDRMVRTILELRDGFAAELTNLLTTLAAANVEFVLVGALAAVAQGAPLTTHDVDIVHRRSPENVDRLLAVLATLDARYRGRPRGEILRPTREALLGPGHSLLITALGPLDVLGAIERGQTHDDLVGESIVIGVGGLNVHVLGLRTLVDLKRGSTHPKDRYTLAVLEETLRRQGQL